MPTTKTNHTKDSDPISPDARIASTLMGVRLEKAKEETEKPKKHPYRMRHPEEEKKRRGEQIKPHQWKPGQSGNPKGRPKTKISLTALLNDLLSTNQADAEEIARVLIALSKQGDMRAIEMAFERNDGKVPEVRRAEGEMAITIQFLPAQEFLANKALQEAQDENVLEGEYKVIPDEFQREAEVKQDG